MFGIEMVVCAVNKVDTDCRVPEVTGVCLNLDLSAALVELQYKVSESCLTK
jgi:hypothetical protein